MHLLLTRQLEDCSDLIVRFKELGHIVSHLPLLNIEKVEYNQKSLEDCKCIIFTSANAIKFLNTKEINKNIKCFCVGSATEKKAKSVGFQNIISADGNVRNLIELILQNFKPTDGKIIYVSGEIISSDLSKFSIDVSIIEKVHAMPRQGVTSSFQFGRSFGGIDCSIRRVESTSSSPKVSSNLHPRRCARCDGMPRQWNQ